MRLTVKKLLVSSNHDDFIIKEWKIAAFSKALTYCLIPLTISLIIGFLAFGVWQMAAAVAGLLVAFIISVNLAKNKHLFFSVNLAIIATSLTNFYFLLYRHSSDGLYFTVFMIIIAGIFLGIRAAFLWAFIEAGVLLILAYCISDYTIFPDFSIYFTRQDISHSSTRYFIVHIFLYFVSAFLSILFERYFRDLLQKVKQSHDEKVFLESELLQSQKMESIGLLVSGIAHDFGKGLSSIKSSANLILTKFCPQNEELARYAQNIYNSCGMISNSSNKLLAFARKSNDEMTYLNMHDVLESMTNLLEFMLGNKIRIDTIFKAQQSTISGNFSQLQSMFMNLAVNAYDAMPQGGVLTFSTVNNQDINPDNPQTEKTSVPLNFLEIKVSDNGTGMDESITKKLFTPFFTTKGPDKGTGLGLSNVQRIIKSHNGAIHVFSEKGKGTTFTIHLPLASKSSGKAAT